MNDDSPGKPQTEGPACLIMAQILDCAGGSRMLDEREIPTGIPDSGILWLHLDYSADDADSLLSSQAGLSEQVMKHLLADDTRPHIYPMETGLLVVLRGVNTNPGADPDDMVSIRLWLEPGRIISTRRRRLRSIQDMQQALEEGRGPTTPGSFLSQLIDFIGARASAVIGDLEEAVAELEARLESENQGVSALRRDLSELRRQSAVIRRHLAPQRDALDRLTRENHPLLSEADRLKLRDASDLFRRHVEELELARERTLVAHEHLQSLIAEQQNQRMFTLSVVAAIFLPLGFITGLLGMNVGGIPGEGKPYAFAVLIAVMVVLAGGLIVLFRWRRWF